MAVKLVGASLAPASADADSNSISNRSWLGFMMSHWAGMISLLKNAVMPGLPRGTCKLDWFVDLSLVECNYEAPTLHAVHLRDSK